MSARLKNILKAFAFIAGLFLIIWLGVALYVSSNQEKIKAKLLIEINNKISGELTLGGFKTSLFRGFPAISFTMHEVKLRDSLWNNHKHDLLQAQEIDLQLSIWGLVTGSTSINKLKLRNATAYLYTDSNGYSNTQLFKQRASAVRDTSKSSPKLPFYKIDFEGVQLHIDNQLKSKGFSFDVKQAKGNFKDVSSGWKGNLKIQAELLNFAFNTKRGSFLKNKAISGQIDVDFNEDRKDLSLKSKNLKIDKDPFDITANLSFNQQKPNLSLLVQAKQVLYKNLVQLMAPNISDKLKRFDIGKPVDVSAEILDTAQVSGQDPLIQVRLIAKKTSVSFPSGHLDKASFTGMFTNQENAQKAIGDENSLIQFYELTADFYNAPLEVDTFSIQNLNQPIASGLVKSKFPLTGLNESLDKNLFQFKKGEAQVQIYCKMDIENLEFTKPEFTGTISVSNADVNYVPRKINLVNSQFELAFNQQDLQLKNAKFNWNKSVLNVNAEVKNLLNLYYNAPEKINADVNISSDFLSLNEFITFLSPRPNPYVKKKSNRNNWIDQLGRVLEESSLHLNLDVKQARYKNFIASPLKADVSLLNKGIALRNVKIGQAGGLLTLNGNIKQERKRNSFQIRSQVSKVNVAAFFKAFDNFGQKTLQHRHLKGFLNAQVQVSGQISNTGDIYQPALKGVVDFKLDKAALLNFEPLQKIQKFAFKSRDFNNIQIEQLNGKLSLEGDKVHISPMQINTSVINFNVEGVYAYKEGTEIAVAVPLRNPKKDEGIVDQEVLKKNRMKGVVIRLLAVDDNKGGVKIKWRP